MGLFAPKTSESAAVLGIDIGSGLVKMVQLEQSGVRTDLRAAGSYSVDPILTEKGVIRDPRRFGRQLGGQLAKMGATSVGAVVSVPSSLAVMRWVQLPPLEGDELRDAARFKVKKHLPFNVATAYIEATPPEVEIDGLGQSLVIAVPREVIDSRAEAIEHAGLIPVAAEMEAQAILRVADRRMSTQSALWRDASLTIIDLGSTNTHMYVVQNQRLQFIRGVKFGSRMIAEALAKELDIPVAEADLMLAQNDTELWTEGILKVRQGDVFKLVYITNELDKLTREFLRLLRYFRSLHPERSYAGILDHVLLCGGLAGMPGFAEYLQEALELRVERARPIAGMVAHLDQHAFTTISNRQEAYTVVVGLALSGLGQSEKLGRDKHARHEYGWSRAA